MKRPRLGPMPWDMVVFLTVVTIGFGFSMQKMMNPDSSTYTRADPNPLSLALDETARSVASTTPTIDLGCIEQNVGKERLTSQEGAIRIKGRFCHLNHRAMHGFDGMRVKNVTNGYEGTIFFRGFDSSFVSDYLVLQSGKNVVELEWRESQTADPHVLTAEIFEK